MVKFELQKNMKLRLFFCIKNYTNYALLYKARKKLINIYKNIIINYNNNKKYVNQ